MAGLIAQYNCLFGIANLPDSPLKPGEVDTCYGIGRCASTIAGKDGRTYFFAEERLDKTYRLDNLPRYTDQDADDWVRRHGDITIRPGLTLADIWARTFSSRLVPLEEAAFQLWTWGRIACAGDSIHKTTPNLGSGGNAAIESAASLANHLKVLADDSGAARPTETQIRSCLAAYHEEREGRVAGSLAASADYTRLNNMEGWASWLFVRFGLALLADFLQDMIGDFGIGAVKLDYLPLPRASLQGTNPFNPAQGFSRNETRLGRALRALPLLLILALALVTLDATVAFPWAEAVLERGVVVEAGSVPIRRTFYHVQWLDDL